MFNRVFAAKMVFGCAKGGLFVVCFVLDYERRCSTVRGGFGRRLRRGSKWVDNGLNQ